MYELLLWLQGEMTTPTNYSWFHIMFLVITVGVTVLLCLFFKDSDEKTFRRIILIAWIIIVVFEIYKEVIFSFNYNSENHWKYQWYSFPFQMCSTPFYILPFIAFLPRGKFQKSATRLCRTRRSTRFLRGYALCSTRTTCLFQPSVSIFKR